MFEAGSMAVFHFVLACVLVGSGAAAPVVVGTMITGCYFIILSARASAPDENASLYASPYACFYKLCSGTNDDEKQEEQDDGGSRVDPEPPPSPKPG